MKTVHGFQWLTILSKSSIGNVLQSPVYASDITIPLVPTILKKAKEFHPKSQSFVYSLYSLKYNQSVKNLI